MTFTFTTTNSLQRNTFLPQVTIDERAVTERLSQSLSSHSEALTRLSGAQWRSDLALAKKKLPSKGSDERAVTKGLNHPLSSHRLQ
jgi:hypothetical protein